MNKRQVGARGEDLAVSFLLQKGYRILDRNSHKRWGEIDIIAQDSGTLIFIEVKYRTSDRWGSGVESITPRKLHNLHRAAALYSHEHQLDHMPQRIDVISIDLDTDSGQPYITHIQNSSEERG
jgi:putative endonuclease